MKKVYCFLCLFVALGLSLPGAAQNMRYQQNIKGGFAVTANSLMASNSTYANTAGGTTMSSYADLVLPPGSTIVKAFLYVERYAGGAITTAKFRVPGGSYITYTTASAGFIGNPGNAPYQQFIVDVTSVMPASNAYVTTVTTGGNAAGVGRYAVADANATINNGYGWSLYVAYTNPASRYRNVSVFDAALRYSGSTGSTSFLINNIVVPSSGPISANLGVTGCWGGVNSSGANGGYADFISFGKDGGPYTDLTDPYMNTTNDIFNSSVAKAANNNVSTDGGPAMSGNFTARNPYAYTAYGNPNWSSVDYDADIIDASGILPNSTTPISVRMTQSSPYSDVLGSGAYALSVDIAAAVLTKSVAPSRICDGDTATYFFKITNKELGALAQSGIAFTDNMPSGLRAIPGSGTITGGSGGTVTATATAITVSGLSLAINDSAIVAVKVTNVAGQTNPSCSANPVAFTNGFNNISGISNNLVNSITPQCLEVMSKQTPTFTQVGPYCQGAVIPALPTTSNNGITGSWSSAINNTATTTYTFTPAPGQCGTVRTMTIVVNPGTSPVFSQAGPYCAGASIPALPTTSNNGISGTWSPAINNTTTTTYTFTPTPVTGQCYLPATMTITINPNTTPSFTQAGPYCAGASIPALPTTSNNGISGTWSPAINNATTTTYTFTPTPVTGQCYLPATMTIIINPNITPSFTQVGPYCTGTAISTLPTTSNNGISGTWSPAINNTATTTYTFSPSSGQCAVPANMTVTVNDRIHNTVNVTICQGKTYTFNGVTHTTSQSGLKDTFTTAGCDSIVTLNLNVTPYPTGTDVKTICQGQSYVFNGIAHMTANNTAKDTFQTAAGCDSIVTLNLTVTPYLTGTANVTICQGKTYTFNGITYTTPQTGLKDTLQSAAGCDSIVTLNLNVTPYPTGTDVKTICQGQVYVFNGIAYTTANNTAKDTFQTAAGCDSIVTLNLTVTPYLTGTANVTICQGKTYPFNGITYTTPQTGLKDTLQTTSGCDSIVTLNLNVTPYPTGTDVKTICQGQVYVFNGIAYTTANNTAKDTFQTAAGCDSIVTLNLTVTPYLTGTDVKTICQGQSYSFNGITYTTANNTAKDTFQTAGGCDSIVTLNLTVTPYLTGTANVTICQGKTYTFNGITYTTPQSGLKDTLQSAAGCDSIVTLNLNVTPYPTGTDVKTICQGQSYVFNGIAYTTANNTAKDTFQTAAGCDSIVTLNLTVTPYLTGTDVKTICQGQSYIFNGITYTTSNSTAKDTLITSGGCDSIVTLNLTVTPYLTGTANVTICQGQSYSFNGINYNTSQSGLKDTLVGAAGCDSIVTLNLTVSPYLTGTDVRTICQGQSYIFNGITYTTSNNTAKDTLVTIGGCDSIVTLNLTVTPYLTGTANVTICQGQSYSFNGINYNTSQSGLKDTLVGAAGCDSIVTLNLTVTPYLTGTDVKTICQGQSYTFNGVTYTTSNSTAKDTLATSGGCDSIVTLNLTVTPYLTGTVNVTICQGQTYSFNGINYNTSQSGLKDTLVGAAGCDSIVTLNLTVSPYLTGTDVRTICQGQSYIFNGITYTTSNNTAKDTLVTIGGCDSIVTLNLTVTPYLTGTDVKTICQGQSYTFNGVTYTTSNSTAKDTLATSGGCDSIVTLNLTVTPYLTGTANVTICQGQSYSFNGISYNTSQSGLKDTLVGAAGCDSIVTLNLTVTPYLTGTDVKTICQGQSYIFNGIIYTTSNSTAKDTLITSGGCDSIVTLNLTVTPYLTGTDVKTICQGQSYSFNGVTYTTSNNTAKDTLVTIGGCDSIVTLNLTVTPYLTGTDVKTICQGQSYTFNGVTYTTSNSTAKDTLATSGGCDSIVTLNLTVTPYLTGTANVTICQGQSYSFNGATYTTSNNTAKDTFQTAGGCDSIVTLNLAVTPYLTGTDVKTICQGQGYMFNGVTYTASNNTATDTLKTSGGCDSIVTLNLTVAPYLTGIDEQVICEGESYTFNGVVYTTSNTTATDTLQTWSGCDSIVTLNLSISPLPDVKIGIDMDRTGPFCTGDTVQLRGSGARDYTWSDYRGLLGHGETIRLLLPQAGNSYRVLGRDESGCADTAQIFIATEPCCNLNMPNAFSPNGDGLNDEIGPIGNGHPLGYRFRVFNRWGQLVFVSYKLEDRWKGTMNGALVDPGTYFYVIGGTCVDGTPIALHGDITLIR